MRSRVRRATILFATVPLLVLATAGCGPSEEERQALEGASDDPASRVFFLITVPVWLLLAVGAHQGLRREGRQYGRSVAARARVLGIETEEYDEGNFYQVVVEFRADPDGLDVTATVPIPDHLRDLLTSGSVLPIRYDPQNPTTIWLLETSAPPAVSGTAVVLLLIAAASLAAGLGFLPR
ncbi:DUF3592 domain-containing protein [Streptomyces sp. 3MP-14]|uniref:DUF3592 domain-containing protein n=1 Tax=Streptomyces mimosae TaxID=2586635 RepID=A0A5N6AM60_9ACTN|nr:MULTISPECIES: DUF3592 domain-containing protein [Streptomyces]KAB8168698.1 DUF3592 domain-containing protein [Streptomyces mimosae]KAB8178022.1 DUF3592 domain-containing protein [Streptomyces sp. 3MP-14]